MVASFVSSYFFCTPNMGLTLYISVAHLIGHSDRFLHVSWFYLDNIPDRINPRPSWFGIGSIRFAFVVRLEPQDPSTRFEGARACTVGTFHERNATVQKTCIWWVWWAASCPTGLRSWSQARFEQKEPDPPVLWVPKSVSQAGHSGRDLFCFRPARLLLPCELRWRGVQAWSCSIINPKRITAQHEQFSGFL